MYLGGLLVMPAPSLTTIVDVFTSILSYLKNTSIFGTFNVGFVINFNSSYLEPAPPAPIALLEPLAIEDAGDAIGGGRFSKTYSLEFILHIVVLNIYDQSFKDSFIVESSSGPYELAHLVINSMEQAYLLNSYGQPTLIEFPFYIDTMPIDRYKDTTAYMDIPIKFRVLFRQNLPLSLP